ncbi:MAG: HD domain-containing phosphohydrolase [Thermoanaerobaculaceae bacterium]
MVLTSAPTLLRWPRPLPANVLWVVMGDNSEELPVEPFLVVPPLAEKTLVRRAIFAALEIQSLRQKLASLENSAQVAQEKQLELVRIGIALVAERNLDRLLERILTSARELVDADAGSLYLLEERGEEKFLQFMLAQNDSVPLALSSRAMPADHSSLAGFVALSGEAVALEDARHASPNLPYRFNPTFDQLLGYHTRSILTVPMATRSGEVVGVLQLINRKRQRGARIRSSEDADRWVVPFSQSDVSVIRAMAAHAAVAIENTFLVRDIKRLFESFVRAAVMAIEQRDPSTKGHSVRVAHYTVSLAKAVEQNPPPRFRDLRFSQEELLQLRYAALLHDFGKLGVREAVLTKPKKLYPDRLALVQERFRHAQRAQEVVLLRSLLERLMALGQAPTGEDLQRLEETMGLMKADLAMRFAKVLEANEPTVLASDTAHVVRALADATFPWENGESLPLLTREELRSLSVPLGSLDEDERQEVESHVVHTYKFLLTLPWPKQLARVPEIAYGHHEKLNGTGYPRRLRGEQIPPEVRMLTICDMYDALAAADRPYKKAVSPGRALEILEEETKKGALDPDLFQVFVEARIFTSVPPLEV